MHVSTNKHTHTHTAFWCPSASSMCWVGLSDFWRLVKCNHSYLPYSPITARTNGMLTVQRHGAIVFILYASMFVCTCCAPTSAYYVESGLINEWRDGFECPSSGRSCVKAAICVFSVCLTMHARKGMLTGLCVCVFACFLGNQQFVFASVAFFSADNKKSGNGSFSATATPSGELITTNNCHSEQPGLHLKKKKKSHCSLSLYFFWWPILARLAVEAQMQYCDKEPASKNTWNEKKKTSHHILSLRGWFDLYPFPGF